MSRMFARPFSLVALLLLAGCSGPRTVEIFGTVTLDGAPLAEAEIHLTAVDNSHMVVVAKIEGGKYKVRIPLGAKRVELYASKLSDIDMGNGVKMPVQYLAARYNSESTLTAEVTPEKTQFDFTLTSDAQPPAS